MITYPITLNVNSNKIQKRIIGVSGEGGSRTLRISLMQDGKPVKLDESMTASVCGVKPDGTVFSNIAKIVDADIDNGVILYTITTQNTAVAGDVECQVRVMNKDKILYSSKFILEVEDNLTDISAETSTNEFTELTEALNNAYWEEQDEYEITDEWIKGMMLDDGIIHEEIPVYSIRCESKGYISLYDFPDGWSYAETSVSFYKNVAESGPLDKGKIVYTGEGTVYITVASNNLDYCKQFKFKTLSAKRRIPLKDMVDSKASKEYVDTNNESIRESIKALVDNDNTIIDDLNKVESIAKNATIAKSYSGYSEMVNALNTLPMESFKIGQVIHIATRDVPDVWIGNISETAIVYDFVSDEQFLEDMSPSYGVKVGYFYLIPCEADLSKYYNKEYIDNNVVPIARKIVGIPLDRDIDTYDIVKHLEGYPSFVYAVENAMLDSNVVSTYFGTSTVIKAINSYFYLKDEIDKKINDIKLAHIVDELPETGLDGILYFVPKTDPETNDVYDEYRYINNAWELIGTKQITIDLTPYVKKTRTIANFNLENDITAVDLIVSLYINAKESFKTIVNALVNLADSSGTPGTVRLTDGSSGIKDTGNNYIGVAKATDEEVEDLSNQYKPIVPSNLKKAVETIGGVLDELTTEDKSSYVAAINELKEQLNPTDEWTLYNTYTADGSNTGLEWRADYNSFKYCREIKIELKDIEVPTNTNLNFSVRFKGNMFTSGHIGFQLSSGLNLNNKVSAVIKFLRNDNGDIDVEVDYVKKVKSTGVTNLLQAEHYLLKIDSSITNENADFGYIGVGTSSGVLINSGTIEVYVR